MVSAIRLIGIAFIQLVEVDDLRFPIGKAHIAKSCNGVGGGSVLEQAVAKKQAEVFGIVFRQTFLFVSQRKDGVRKVGFTIISCFAASTSEGAAADGTASAEGASPV